MFLSDSHRVENGSAQVIDFVVVFPPFRLGHFEGDVRTENFAHPPGCSECASCSFYPEKGQVEQWNKAMGTRA
jgi:hypothetical protein